MKVKDILKQKGPEVITIWEDKSIISAVETMVQNKIGALLVMDEKGMITGIISERDILRVIHFHLDKLREMKVREAMVKKVLQEPAAMSDSLAIQRGPTHVACYHSSSA